MQVRTRHGEGDKEKKEETFICCIFSDEYHVRGFASIPSVSSILILCGSENLIMFSSFTIKCRK